MNHFSLSLRVAVAVTLMAPALAAHAGTCQAHSPAQTVAVVELYTSEGCSSCPPADRWLTELSRRFTAEQLLPLALHVDYWDYIGWTDEFAQARFSERQRRLSQLVASNTIYTPEVFTGMKEFRNWSDDGSFARRIEAINGQPARAKIDLRLQSIAQASSATSAEIEVKFELDAANAGRRAQGVVVVYEKQLSTTVRAGENRGATLRHDNVVRYWSAPVALNAQTGRAEWRQTLPLPADWKRENLGVAALVEDPQAGEILQAVALPACFGLAKSTATGPSVTALKQHPSPPGDQLL
ncbi:MAG: DUF1223 domain-containing protein [Propionivibrio sp.]